MIIKDFQIEKIVNENEGFLPILIYGPNEGLIRDHIGKIKSDYLSDIDFEEVSITGKSLDLNPDILATSCLLYTSPSPRDGLLSRMPSSA